MGYANWGDYRGVFLGRLIGEADFPRLARRAGDWLDYYTRGRAAERPEDPALLMACCAIAEAFYRIEQAERAAAPGDGVRDEEGHEVVRETAGERSAAYPGPEARALSALRAGETAARLEAELPALARRYLAGTDLLYRGGVR